MSVRSTAASPTHRPPREESADVHLRRLTPFKLKLLVSLHHLRGHHALNLRGGERGDKKWEGNKQVIVHIYSREAARGNYTFSV